MSGPPLHSIARFAKFQQYLFSDTNVLGNPAYNTLLKCRGPDGVHHTNPLILQSKKLKHIKYCYLLLNTTNKTTKNYHFLLFIFCRSSLDNEKCKLVMSDISSLSFLVSTNTQYCSISLGPQDNSRTQRVNSKRR